MKLEQDLTAQINAAVAIYRTNPKPLRRLSAYLRQSKTRKACGNCAKKLLKKEPFSKDAIASLIFAYADRKCGDFRTALDLAHQRAEGDPEILNKIMGKVMSNMDAKELNKFNMLLQEYNHESAENARRQTINLQAQARLLKRTHIEPHTCDVITVASNEGPYIAEFIHHYLYQGFSNLFIGLNNDTSEKTGPIISAIAQHYPQVHLIDTDQEHQKGRQRGSCCKLYDEASKITKSTHCMVVDVDESWVAYPFSTKIQDFLTDHRHSDVISSNWVHCHGGNLFDNPLDLSNTHLRITDKFKSLFRYGIAATDLGAHVPWVLAEPKILHTSSDGNAIHSKAINGLRRLSKSGTQACIQTANTSWVIHRFMRSELEYANKLLYPDANNNEIPFKPGRKGYLHPEESFESSLLAKNLFGNLRIPPKSYIESLERFIEICGVRNLITDARSDIDEKLIKNRIERIQPTQIRKYRDIWTRTFRGTRFLELLEQRSGNSCA